jgi:nitrate reductase gamma subunit
MVDTWIALARGPLFRFSLAVLVLGLGYLTVTTIFGIVRSWLRAGDRDLPLGAIARSTARWVVPIRLIRARPAYSLASVVFHAGILLVPLFSIGHVGLWRSGTGIPWPVLPAGVADALSVAALVALAGLLIGRLSSRAARGLSRTQDVLVLVLLLAVAATGVLVAHPGWAPFDARALLLLHLLLADATLVLTPLTKMAHCILFPFLQLAFEVGWHFPAATGRHVAIALAKEDERV